MLKAAETLVTKRRRLTSGTIEANTPQKKLKLDDTPKNAASDELEMQNIFRDMKPQVI